MWGIEPAYRASDIAREIASAVQAGEGFPAGVGAHTGEATWEWWASRGIEMRIGVGSGPVTAGVIGRKKFSYDLWGDAVNVASRMESSGVPGHIQVSTATRHLVSPWFQCERRGVVEVGGKGEVETWFLIGRIADRGS